MRVTNHVWQYYSHTLPKKWDSRRNGSVCFGSVLYLERYYIICELHDLASDIAGDSLSLQLLIVFQVKCCWQWNQIRKQGPHNLIPCYTARLKYYTPYSLRPLVFEIHVTCSGARYPKIKPHKPHRYTYSRIVVFSHSVLYSPYNAWVRSCWNTTSVS